MNAAEILESYRRACLQSVSIRRYSGTSPRTSQDYAASGNSSLYTAQQLVGSIKQGDRRVIVITQDLVDAGLTLPLTTDDRVVIDGKVLGIVSVSERNALEADESAKRITVAYEIQARG